MGRAAEIIQIKPKLALGYYNAEEAQFVWDIIDCGLKHYKSLSGAIEFQWEQPKLTSSAYRSRPSELPTARWVFIHTDPIVYRSLVKFIFNGALDAPVTIQTLNTENYEWGFYNALAQLPSLPRDFRNVTFEFKHLRKI